jgi:homoserine kinase type II
VAAWLHPLLRQLSSAFPVPVPLPLYEGGSWASVGTTAWEALSWLPGHEVGFSAPPSLHDVGAFLARFHLVSTDRGPPTSRRPSGTPLRSVPEAVDWDGALVTMGSADAVLALRDTVDRFAADLERVGYHDLETCLVHGDPTTFNVLADGSPPQPSGLIDFELADVEPPIADVAFCLWRSGRSAQRASELDLRRVQELMTGYRSIRTVSEGEVAALPVCLRGRGLQMLAKRSQMATADSGPAVQLRWIEDHEHALITAALGTIRR